MAQVPTSADVIAYMGVSPAQTPTDQVDEALEAQLEAQQRTCDVTAYGADLRRAAIRRAARSLAARSVPLGILSDLGEFGGAAQLRAWDAEIEQLEAPYRFIPVG